MSKLLIRNARIARPDGSVFEGDVLCQNRLIERIAPQIGASADEILDVEKNPLLPGVIDPQVHFHEPGKEYKEDLASRSRAAVKGGVTSFLEMPNTDPSTTNQAALDHKLKRAAQKSVANYGFFIGATPHNLDDLLNVHPVNEEMFTKVRWSPFNGRRLSGWPIVTVVDGQIAYSHGKIREGVHGRALTLT